MALDHLREHIPPAAQAAGTARRAEQTLAGSLLWANTAAWGRSPGAAHEKPAVLEMHVWVMIVLPETVVSMGWGGLATTERASTRCKSSLTGPYLTKFSSPMGSWGTGGDWSITHSSAQVACSANKGTELSKKRKKDSSVTVSHKKKYKRYLMFFKIRESTLISKLKYVYYMSEWEKKYFKFVLVNKWTLLLGNHAEIIFLTCGH